MARLLVWLFTLPPETTNSTKGRAVRWNTSLLLLSSLNAESNMNSCCTTCLVRSTLIFGS